GRARASALTDDWSDHITKRPIMESPLFEPIAPRESAVETCARTLRRAIIEGKIPVGSRLPPERKLAESFGVNRVTVRGALAQLATSRLLSVRQGSGYVVRDFREEGGPDLIAGLAELAAGKQL